MFLVVDNLLKTSRHKKGQLINEEILNYFENVLQVSSPKF